MKRDTFTTDGDRLAWLDSHKAAIQIGRISHGASVEFEDGWVLRVTNGADMVKTSHPTLRHALDALQDAVLPTGELPLCGECNRELDEDGAEKCEGDDPLCDTCNSELLRNQERDHRADARR